MTEENNYRSHQTQQKIATSQQSKYINKNNMKNKRTTISIHIIRIKNTLKKLKKRIICKKINIF